MTRAHALAYMKVAGYHDDSARFTRLYAENRVSMPAARAAYRAGAEARAKGVPCSCADCNGRTPNPRRAFIVNPSQPAGRRAVELGITDRALRYRANANAPEGPKLCAYCGSHRNVEVEHVDGREENSDPRNLLWACRSCNTTKGHAFKRAGMGRKTRQYNPTPAKARGARTIGEWLAATRVVMGARGTMTPAAAVQRIQATPPERRAQFAGELARKRANPDPSFAAYLEACENHRPKAHDAGGAVIHRTSKAKRSEYGRQIAEIKRKRGSTGRRTYTAAELEQVPF